jgi:uncharacterized protein (TIRG00374 family)
VLSWILRSAVGIAILATLAYSGLLNVEILSQAFDHPGLLALATFLLAMTIPLAAIRWWVLLRSLDYPMTIGWSLRTTLLTSFLHTFLPGAYGGDIARVALAYRAAKGGLSRLTLTVIVDRLSGLLSLMLLAVLVLPMLPFQIRKDAFIPLAIAVAVMVIGTIAAIGWGEHLATVVERLPKVGKKISYVIREVLAAFRIYLDRWTVLFLALLISLVQFALILLALIIIGAAMKFNALPASGYVVAGVWSIVANSIPLTPGGLGIGEAAFARIAVMLETSRTGASYATVFLGMRVLTILVSAIGVIPYLPRRFQLRRDMAMVSAAPAENETVSR